MPIDQSEEAVIAHDFSEQTPAPAPKLAQGIQCGPWALALPFDWARTVIEQFELVEIPKAPAWLAGACNIEGNILPVIDLAAYFSPEITATNAGQAQRLLVGGVSGDNAENAIALLFSELPQQVRYITARLDTMHSLPAQLHDVCAGVARTASGKEFIEVDGNKLVDALSNELSAQ